MSNDPTLELRWHASPCNDKVCKDVGKITFSQTPHSLLAKVIADGLALTIPTEIELAEDPLPFQLSQIRTTISQAGMEVGVAYDFNIYGVRSRRLGNLVARLPAHIVRMIEHVRAGGPVMLDLEPQCELDRLVPQQSSGLIFRTAPQTQQLPHNRKLTVIYPTELWVKMLNTTGFGENVVVEIPLPPSPGPEWAPIWKAIATARDALKKGGDTASKSAIVECRHALEEWQKLEKEDHGPGWKSPTPAEKSARTRQQRLDNIRWDLLQCAHDAAHTPADKWTRDDAVLVLATLAGLLAIRNP